MIGKFLARPAVTDWLITRAKKTPYMHIVGDDGSVYMERYWLFNPYPSWFPISIRLQRIMRADTADHKHDHPWNARTFILRDWYAEVRSVSLGDDSMPVDVRYTRRAGDTATIKFGEYHHIEAVAPGGVWTLFVTGKYRGSWGFLVAGRKVKWRTYLGLEDT